jgi:hypothetical protein
MDWLMSPSQSDLRALIAEINHAGIRNAQVRSLLMDYSVQYATMIATMVEQWQCTGQIGGDRPPPIVAQMFLAQASGLCAASALEPALLANPRFRTMVHDQLDMLLGGVSVPD